MYDFGESPNRKIAQLNKQFPYKMAEIFVAPTPVKPIQALVKQYLAGEGGGPKPQRGELLHPVFGHQCVCQVCSGYKCSCVERHQTPTTEQIGMCMVHGEDMFAADIYRAIHAAHDIAIIREMAHER